MKPQLPQKLLRLIKTISMNFQREVCRFLEKRLSFFLNSVGIMPKRLVDMLVKRVAMFSNFRISMSFENKWVSRNTL